MTVTRLALSLSLLLSVGCDGSVRDSRVPPFRIRPYGPGLEVISEGRKYEFWNGTELAGKVRVSSNAIRIYDGDARLLGRLSPLVDGWRILRVDGSTLCQVSPLGADTQLDCDWGEATLGGDDDRLVIHVDGEEWLRLVAGEGWWTETPGQPDALGRWSDGSALSIQTHPDAWSHTAVRPEWGAPSVIAWSLDFPGIEDGDDRLMGGTLAYLMARRLAAAGGVAQAASTSDGSAHSSSVSTEGEP